MAANVIGCSDVHLWTLLCLGDTCFGQNFSQIYRIWIRASNRFELRFSDRNICGAGLKLRFRLVQDSMQRENVDEADV